MPFPPRFRDGARNAAPSSCRSSLRCRERRAVVRAEPDWLPDALAHRDPPASGFAARVRAWSAVLRGRHGTTTRRAGSARSNDGTCVRPCWPRAHRGRQPCVLIWPTAAAGPWQKSRALRASGGMADAHGSGPCVRKDVGVQLPPRPPTSAGMCPRNARTVSVSVFLGAKPPGPRPAGLRPPDPRSPFCFSRVWLRALGQSLCSCCSSSCFFSSSLDVWGFAWLLVVVLVTSRLGCPWVLCVNRL